MPSILINASMTVRDNGDVVFMTSGGDLVAIVPLSKFEKQISLSIFRDMLKDGFVHGALPRGVTEKDFVYPDPENPDSWTIVQSMPDPRAKAKLQRILADIWNLLLDTEDFVNPISADDVRETVNDFYDEVGEDDSYEWNKD